MPISRPVTWSPDEEITSARLNQMQDGLATQVDTALANVSSGSNAANVNKLANVEPTSDPYGFDQIRIPSQPQSDGVTSTISRITTGTHWEGTAHLRRVVNASSVNATADGTGFSRGILEIPNGALSGGNEIWFGGAFKFDSNYYSKKAYSEILRLDCLVDADGNLLPQAQQQNLSLACFADGTWYVVHETIGSGIVQLASAIPTSYLLMNRWNWVEMHAKISSTDGQALTELYINGAKIASSDLANYTSGRPMYNRTRYGIVSTGSNETSRLQVDVDRAYVSGNRRAANSSLVRTD